MSLVLIAALVLLPFALIWGVLLAVAEWDRRRNPGPWLHENAACRCGHCFYDHAHWLHGAPCATLMCSCESWTPTKENHHA